MGYWPPPGIHAYDPLARPLGGTPVATEDQVHALTSQDVLDRLGVSTLYDAQAKAWLEAGGTLWIPDILDVPLLEAMRPSPLVINRGLLLAYSLLYALRPPPSASSVHYGVERLHGPFSPEVVFPRFYYGDLPDGGLPADVMQPGTPLPSGGVIGGAIVENYWDLSDANWPRRKCVTWWPKSSLVGSGEEDQAKHAGDPKLGRPYANDDGVVYRVMQWNFDSQKWEDEGGDVERELSASGAEIISTVLLVLKMVVSCVPVFGGALSSMVQLTQDAWALELRHIRPDSGPITTDEVFSALGGDLIGLVGAFGGSVVGYSPDGKPITTADVLSKAANDTFNATMAKVQAFPVVGLVSTVTVDAVTQGTKYVQGVVEIGKIYGIGNIKVSTDDIKKYVQAQFQGQKPAPVAVETKVVGDAGQAASPAEMPEQTYQRQAWEAACLAYTLFPDDGLSTMRLRRNVVLTYRNTLGGNSATIVTPGDEGGVIAHGVEDLNETALDVGTAFDQYLSQMHANEWAGSFASRAQYALSEVFHPATDPFHGQSPRAPLDSIVATLKKRYGI